MSGRFKRESRSLPKVLTEISYTEDTIKLKSLVTWVFVLNTLHVFLVSAGVWQAFVVHFGNDAFLAYNHPPIIISITVTSIVSSTVQSFFIHRIWLLMRSRFRWLVPAILMPFVFAQLVLGVCKCGIRRKQSAAHIRLCSLHGRSNRVSNEPFRRYRTTAYYSGQCTERSCHGGRHHHHDLFMYASRHVPNWVSSRHGSNASPIDFYLGQHWPLISALRLPLRHPVRHISDRSHLHRPVLPTLRGVLQHDICEPQRALVRPRRQ
jgi:hypothetical protein